MPESAPAVKLESVSFGYASQPAARPALEDVNLRVEADDFLGVIGPNGGGKTTLLKIILGLLRPQKGRVRVLGLPAPQARRFVGYVPQQAAIDLSAPASVLDTVLMGRLSRSAWGCRFSRRDREIAMEALASTRLADHAAHPMRSLSGGQRQRALVARALASEARILLLDEPTAGIDSATERSLIDLLHRLNERMPIVMVSHDISFVSAHLKRVACLNRTLTCHAAHDISREIITETYREPVRLIRHEPNCPLADPGCDHGHESAIEAPEDERTTRSAGDGSKP
jgi:zinc transport system ATP-binding protein